MPGSNIWRSLLTPRKAASRRGSRSHDFAVAQSDEVRSPGGINVTVVGDVVYGCKSPTSREEDDDTVVSAAATAPLSRPISLRSSADSDDGQRLAEGFRLLLQGGDENLDRACSWFGEAAAACPADASSLHAHAILLVRQQRCHEAEEIFKRILALEGECPSGRTLFRYASLKQLYLAEMVDTRKERVAILEDAAKMYMKVTLMRDAFTVAALFNLAALRFAQGSLDLCEKIYCQILKISEDVDTLSGLSLIRRTRGDLQGAAKLLIRALKIRPGDENLLWRYGRVQQQRGLTVEAATAFARVQGGEKEFHLKGAEHFLCTYNIFQPPLGSCPINDVDWSQNTPLQKAAARGRRTSLPTLKSSPEESVEPVKAASALPETDAADEAGSPQVAVPDLHWGDEEEEKENRADEQREGKARRALFDADAAASAEADASAREDQRQHQHQLKEVAILT